MLQPPFFFNPPFQPMLESYSLKFREITFRKLVLCQRFLTKTQLKLVIVALEI